MDLTTLAMMMMLSLMVAVAAFVFVAALMAILTPEETPVRDRLMALKATEAGMGRGQSDKKMLFETLVALSEPISKNLYGKNQSYQDKMKAVLTEAGRPDNERAVWQFMAQQVASAIVCGGFGFVACAIVGFGKVGGAMGLMIAMIGLIGGLLIGKQMPVFNYRSIAGKRKTEIRYSLPDTLDLMVVCVEAGLGLDATIQRVGEETVDLAPEISHEFKRVTKELNAGIPRTEAFQNLGTRAGVDELKSLCNMISQADKLGTSVAEALRIYADDVRTRRKQKAEELASKASIKMTFPLVLFIFPPLFIILMGPMVIQALGTFFN